MPEGQEKDHWDQASREIDERDEDDLGDALQQSADSGEGSAQSAALEENLSVLGQNGDAGTAAGTTEAENKRPRRKG